jgi:hypothetical protein
MCYNLKENSGAKGLNKGNKKAPLKQEESFKLRRNDESTRWPYTTRWLYTHRVKLHLNNTKKMK